MHHPWVRERGARDYALSGSSSNSSLHSGRKVRSRFVECGTSGSVHGTYALRHIGRGGSGAGGALAHDSIRWSQQTFVVA